MKIIDIEGIGSSYADRLSKAGIRTTETLLKRGGTAEGRKEIESMTGIGNAQILKWVNKADLLRVKGIGGQYSDLLERAGVDTVVELSKRVAGKLLTKMVEVNQAKNLVDKMPALTQVQRWVAQAKKLRRAVSY